MLPGTRLLVTYNTTESPERNNIPHLAVGQQWFACFPCWQLFSFLLPHAQMEIFLFSLEEKGRKIISTAVHAFIDFRAAPKP